MRKTQKSLAAALALLAALSAAAGAESAPRTDFAKLGREIGALQGSQGSWDAAPQAVPPARGVLVEAPGKAAAKEWTVMFFFNQKSDKLGGIIGNLREIEAAGPVPGVNLVAEVGVRDGSGYKAYLSGHDRWQKIPSPDMGDWSQLADFVLWAKRSFPAKRYMLIVNGHGRGWKGLSPDDETGHLIGTRELGLALDRAGPVDVYASDACRMQMAEVVYELKGRASVVIGSEAGVPWGGYDYASLLLALAANPRADAEGLGRAAVEAFGRKYAGDKEGATLSAVRTSAADALAADARAWVEAVMKDGEKPEPLGRALDDARDFEVFGSRDLSDFVELAGIRSKDRRVQAAGQKLQDVVDQDLLVANFSNISHARGLSVHVPTASDGDEASYGRLSWSRASRWDELLGWMSRAGYLDR